MSTVNTQEKIAILASNGFNEVETTSIQRALQAQGLSAKIIGMGNTLLQGWSGNGWGHHFAAEELLNEALAVDYTTLIIPGGRRSIDKLKTTAHTKRFVRGFVEAGKNVALFGEAVELLAFVDCAEGRSVTGLDESRAALEEAGASWIDDVRVHDHNVISATGDDLDGTIETLMEMITGFTSLQKVA